MMGLIMRGMTSHQAGEGAAPQAGGPLAGSSSAR
jgi:hypothetical protein